MSGPRYEGGDYVPRDRRFFVYHKSPVFRKGLWLEGAKFLFYLAMPIGTVWFINQPELVQDMMESWRGGIAPNHESTIEFPEGGLNTPEEKLEWKKRQLARYKAKLAAEAAALNVENEA